MIARTNASTSDITNVNSKRVKAVFTALRLALLGALVVLAVLHVVVNSTPSEPTGMYWSAPFREAPHFGQMVFVCPSPRTLALAMRFDPDLLHLAHSPLSPCPQHAPMLLKTIWGLPGDHMVVRRGGVWRNGRRIPYSRSVLPVTAQDSVVPAGHVFAGTIFPYSYDSRQFGTVIPIANAIGILPDWRWVGVVTSYDWDHGY
jgi:type IV secretory pathway protease TraF